MLLILIVAMFKQCHPCSIIDVVGTVVAHSLLKSDDPRSKVDGSPLGDSGHKWWKSQLI